MPLAQRCYRKQAAGNLQNLRSKAANICKSISTAKLAARKPMFCKERRSFLKSGTGAFAGSGPMSEKKPAIRQP
jgi:hypothetical protein